MEDLKNELNILVKQLEEKQKESQEYYNQRRKIEESIKDKIEAIKKEIFIASNNLSKIDWIIDLGKNDTLYLVPDYKGDRMKYNKWSDEFFDLAYGGWNHFRFIVKSAEIIVNDHDVEIVAVEGKTITDVIKDFNLKISKNKIAEKKQDLEEKLKKISEFEKMTNHENSK